VLRAVLEGPPDRKGVPVLGPEPFEATLGRTLGEEPPWPTLEDTRLQAGEERTWSWSAALPADAPAGDWTLVVTLQPQVRGTDTGTPVLRRRLPLRVD
jgi:hypothetical protein